MVDVVPESFPEYFQKAIKDISRANIREEILVEHITPPTKLAPYSFALGVSIFPQVPPDEHDSSSAFGRIIFLYDPHGHESWDGTLRSVVYLESELESAIALDPLLPEVGWSWLTEGLCSIPHTALGGTVTCTSSYRYGDIIGPTLVYQLEIRASWTALNTELHKHVETLCSVLELMSGLPPRGIASIYS